MFEVRETIFSKRFLTKTSKTAGSIKIPIVHNYVLELEFDVSIEGKNDQHVIKHKNKG